MFFCDKWNSVIDFSQCPTTTDHIPAGSRLTYLEKDTSDPHGNRKWNLSISSEVIDIVSKILEHNGDENHLIHLPFDQSSGLLLSLLNNVNIRNELRQAFSLPKPDNTLKNPYICIHIRRGDCTETSHPEWYISNDFYIHLIDLLLESIPPHYSIVVCTQGNAEWLHNGRQADAERRKRLLIKTTDQLFLNDAEINDFSLMVNADLLFAAGSSFSHWAAYIGRHKIVIDVSRFGSHAVKHIKNINPDNPINESLKSIKNLIESAQLQEPSARI